MATFVAGNLMDGREKLVLGPACGRTRGPDHDGGVGGTVNSKPDSRGLDPAIQGNLRALRTFTLHKPELAVARMDRRVEPGDEKGAIRFHREPL